MADIVIGFVMGLSGVVGMGPLAFGIWLEWARFDRTRRRDEWRG